MLLICTICKLDQLATLERLGNKSASNILHRPLLLTSLAPWHRKLFALGIRHVDETVARILAVRLPRH
ncbi:MAG: hypothetical protein U5L72_19845 [Bacteroidales bacterium]|nr:hypothetical protein [Bacteroidales bacterium]